jgi:hypothetical protein
VLSQIRWPRGTLVTVWRRHDPSCRIDPRPSPGTISASSRSGSTAPLALRTSSEPTAPGSLRLRIRENHHDVERVVRVISLRHHLALIGDSNRLEHVDREEPELGERLALQVDREHRCARRRFHLYLRGAGHCRDHARNLRRLPIR